MIGNKIYFIETTDRIYLFVHDRSQKPSCKYNRGKKITILPNSLLSEIKTLLTTTGDFVKGGIYLPENETLI